MGFLNVLDMVIGLAFVYFLLSLICVALQEIKARWMDERPLNLKKWVYDTFSKDGEEKVDAWKHLFKKIRKSIPFLTEEENAIPAKERGLAGRLWNNIIIDGLTQEGRSASYVPKEVFVSALLDEIHYCSDDKKERKIYQQLEKLKPFDDKQFDEKALKEPPIMADAKNKLKQTKDERQSHLANQPAKGDDQKEWLKTHEVLLNKETLLKGQIEITKGSISLEQPYDFQSIGESIKASGLIPNRIKRVLLQIHNESHSNLDSFRDRLERWFDHAMERNGGTFKKKAQSAVLVFSILVTILLNVDSIKLLRYFYDHPAEAARIADEAERVINDPETAKKLNAAGRDTSVEMTLTEVRASIDQLQALKLPIGWDDIKSKIVKERIRLGKDSLTRGLTKKDSVTAITIKRDSADTILIRKGYQTIIIQACCDTDTVAKKVAQRDTVSKTNQADSIPKTQPVATSEPLKVSNEFGYFELFRWGLDESLLGWLITILAVSLGAPFWYDMLNKLVDLRSAGKKPTAAPAGNDSGKGTADNILG